VTGSEPTVWGALQSSCMAVADTASPRRLRGCSGTTNDTVYNQQYQQSVYTDNHKQNEISGPSIRGVWTADADIRGPGSADFLAVCGSAKQTHLQTRTIRATSIVCRTNLERKCQCTSSQQFQNSSIFTHCSRLCKKDCLTVYGPRHCLQCSVIRPYLWMRTVRRHESPLQLRTRTVRGPIACRRGADYPRT